MLANAYKMPSHRQIISTHYVIDICIIIPIGRGKIQLGKIKNIFTKTLAFQVDLGEWVGFVKQRWGYGEGIPSTEKNTQWLWGF